MKERVASWCFNSGCSRSPDAVRIVRAIALDLAVDHPATVGGLTDPQQHLLAAALLDDVIAVDRFPYLDTGFT